MSNIQEFLKVGCARFSEKLSFFCLMENWLSLDLPLAVWQQQRQVAKWLKEGYRQEYYHSLLHLLSCPVCLDRGYDILANKSHPRLGMIGLESPETYQDILTAPPENEAIVYFHLLYRKLVDPHRETPFPDKFIFALQQGANREEFIQMRTAFAAGSSSELPEDLHLPSIFLDGQEISLFFRADPQGSDFFAGLEGGTPEICSQIKLKLFYYSYPPEELSGEEIALGGAWQLSYHKVQNIYRMELIYQRSSSQGEEK